MQAGFDQKETEREAKMKETLSNLQRIFQGPYKANLVQGAYVHVPQVFAAG